MPYITNEDIERRLGPATLVQLADDDGDGTADAEVVDEARLAAEGEVNSHLARGYNVPVDLNAHPQAAGVVRAVTLDLAELRLRVRRPPVPDETMSRAASARAWLADVAAGRADLPSVSRITAPPPSGMRAAAIGAPRILSLDELEDH